MDRITRSLGPIAAFFVAALLSSCATQFSQLGPDTFMATSFDSTYAVQDATKHCAENGLHILVTNIQRNPAGVDDVVVYKCLSATDPEYQRPDFESVPDVVIQDQRKQ